ncbi:putative methyltransferase-domain-containing protein [Mycena alexandri]|uniref:Methyltransferase-domain-containing protein n=1 Tax=Mycena alexandri TaxID=1745969 RepID=A0AAD6SMM6_9AGAR|nr:putative methyltransferase-domain-containing protein [Mycena alexandri]
MLTTQPPSLHLPPLRGLPILSPGALIDYIEYLRGLYTPSVRGSKIRRRFPSDPPSQTNTTLPHISSQPAPDLDQIAALRADQFERAYTIRWLTYLINNAERLEGEGSEVEKVIDGASNLLANCSGTSSAGIINRVLDFPSPRGVISIALRDIPLENGDFNSVGAQTWGGACVLSEMIADRPADFGLVARDSTTALRVLELGAGTGLVGLTFTAVANSIGIPVSVVCSDFYPSVLENLALNITTNFPVQNPSISSQFLDWSSLADHHPPPLPPPLDVPCDVILGADIIYEPEHASWIHACVSHFLDRSKASEFHLVIPLRQTHALESGTVEVVFRGNLGPTILSKETIVSDVEGNAAQEVEYAYYRIGWSRA